MRVLSILALLLWLSATCSAEDNLLPTEALAGTGLWIQQAVNQKAGRTQRVKVWFDQQFLGDGKGYLRRAKTFDSWTRRRLREAVVRTLKSLSKKSHAAAETQLGALIKSGEVTHLEQHWIINGFTCTVTPAGLAGLRQVKGVKKIFSAPLRKRKKSKAPGGPAPVFTPPRHPDFDPQRHLHPWYIKYLMADKVWKDFKVTGQGTLNIVHDFNFVFSPNLTCNLYQNPKEIPANGKDDDGNGLIDDIHGYDFDRDTANLTTRPAGANPNAPRTHHGYMCAAIICGAGVKGAHYEFGIAPRGRWAGVIGMNRIEASLEWAIEQQADTYSMSFSIPGLGEYRTHWRKLLEHASFCGVFFVSGAGNFGRKGSASYAPVPVQMRTPEDIPNVVFAAAGVQRDFCRTVFSSQGPVRWNTEHYKDGMVDKPGVCAFNQNLPFLQRDGKASPSGLNGNSFAGPMFCGAIALMLSADPDLLPWQLRQIITSTATDIASKGFDMQTGHGLINTFRAVKEVLRRKALREGQDPKPYQGRSPGDELDIQQLSRQASTKFMVKSLQRDGQAAKLGLMVGDVITHYDGHRITSRLGMQLAKTRAHRADKAQVIVRVERGGKQLQFTFQVGTLGVVPKIGNDLPAFVK